MLRGPRRPRGCGAPARAALPTLLLLSLPPASTGDNREDDDAETQPEPERVGAGERWVPAGVTNDQVVSDADEPAAAAKADPLPPTKPQIPRLLSFARDTINSANDWHFAMMNDFQRNKAFAAGLAKVVSQTSTVIDVGAGSGLLSLIAAKSGAKQVYAVEANADLARIAENIIADNDLGDTVSVLRMMSTAVTTDHIAGGADVLVSEVLGTLLLGESALEYMSDARSRLLKLGGHIVPAYATQYATAITSEDLDIIARAHGDMGLNLNRFNELQDTSAVFFTKQLGMRLSNLRYEAVSPALSLFSVDFYEDTQDTLPKGTRVYRFEALRDATVHALLYTWEAWMDKERSVAISTHPNATLDNLPRDMAWGQAMQLVEDRDEAEAQQVRGPVPFKVKKGEVVELVMRNLNTYSHFHGELRRTAGGAAADGGGGEL